MAQITVRHDDFDFRLKPEDYIAVHEKFIERELTETAVIQFTQNYNVPNYSPELIEYMKTAPFWDIQLHGWSHEEYDKMTEFEIADEIQKCFDKSMELFGKHPTVWYPPWNRRNPDMEKVAEAFGMTISNESYDIWKFLREVKDRSYKGTSFYFHAWKNDELSLLDEALNYVEELKMEGK